MNRKVVAVSSAFVLTAFFAEAYVFGQPLTCPSPDSVQTDWQHIENDYFSFWLPPAYEEEKGIMVDSYGLNWRNDGRVIDFDYGWYSSKLDAEDLKQFSSFTICQEAQVDSAQVRPRIVLFPTLVGTYRLSAHWPRLKRHDLGGGTEMWDSLTLGGTVPDTSELPLIMAVIQSVELKRNGASPYDGFLEYVDSTAKPPLPGGQR